MSYLVTGCAGFIGMHVSEKLLKNGETVVGIDNLNTYYDVGLKISRLRRLREYDKFHSYQRDITDYNSLMEIYKKIPFDNIIHLAAQAGVRYSLDHPKEYIDSNIIGFFNILELARFANVKHLVFASSSSVYGLTKTIDPFNTNMPCNEPASLYAATKKSNEAMAHSYAHLFGIPATGLRFFTVYGPWGRPDMAAFIFADRITQGLPIHIYNHGKMSRDFTYIDDIVEGMEAILSRPPGKKALNSVPYKVYNIGRGDPVSLMDFIELLEKYIGRPANRVMMPMQPGDVESTFADTKPLEEDFGYSPSTPLKKGLKKFVNWFFDYYQNLEGLYDGL